MLDPPLLHGGSVLSYFPKVLSYPDLREEVASGREGPCCYEAGEAVRALVLMHGHLSSVLRTQHT